MDAKDAAGLPDSVTREAYSHEVSRVGYRPGSETFPQAAFYSHAYSEPEGFRDRLVTPGARFDATLGIFVLPYDAAVTIWTIPRKRLTS